MMSSVTAAGQSSRARRSPSLPPSAFATETARLQRLLRQANPRARQGPAAELVLAADQFIIVPAGRVKDTARAVNISGEPTLVYPPKQRRSGLDLLFGDVSDYLPTREKLLEQQVGFYYLWK